MSVLFFVQFSVFVTKLSDTLTILGNCLPSKLHPANKYTKHGFIYGRNCQHALLHFSLCAYLFNTTLAMIS